MTLGFASLTDNSMDAVSDRDFMLDFIYACAVCAMHLSRLCEEIIIWSTNEFAMVSLSDSYSTGSSIMPQKKNPDMAELIRGKTGRVLRRPDDTADRHEGFASGVQQGHAGRQGSAVRHI